MNFILFFIKILRCYKKEYLYKNIYNTSSLELFIDNWMKSIEYDEIFINIF